MLLPIHAIHANRARRRFLLAGAAVSAMRLLTPPLAHAQSAYPNKPIRLIVPFPPGGTTDIVSRLAGAELTRSLGQNIIIDNRPGAGTVIGVEACAKAAPDGYTLVCVANSFCINTTLVSALPYDPARDFRPVALMGISDHVLAANPATGLHTLADLIGAAKKSPGKLSFASFGNGTSAHIAGEMLKAQAGIDLIHVPYKGQAPALNDLLGGQVSLMFGNWSEFQGYIRGAKLNALGMATMQRSPFAPDIPTLAEQGIAVVSNSWQGLLTPAAVPNGIAARLNQAVNAALNTASVADVFQKNGIRSLAGSTADFARFLADETARYAKIIHSAHITLS